LAQFRKTEKTEFAAKSVRQGEHSEDRKHVEMLISGWKTQLGMKSL
jgi:hypothetical protein